jgi:myo-inositol-1(or 4)-monophosphatase
MKYLDIAIKAAKIAGKIHKKYFRSNLKIKTKTTTYDLVTMADTEAEKEVVGFIKKYCPGYNFLGEENKYPKTDSAYTWIIDPLDGTNNFACGIPIFSVSIALSYKNQIIIGVIYDVTRDELFYSQKGKGAFLNAKPIRVNKVDNLKQAMFITGFYYDRGQAMIETLSVIKRFFSKNILGLRRFGSAALDLCYVACGRAAGFWEFELSPWDYAAGKLIVEEAGGKVTGQHGEKVPITEKHFIVSSNAKIHSQMLEIINT